MSGQREGSVSSRLLTQLPKLLPGSYWTKIHADGNQPYAVDIIGICEEIFYVAIEVKINDGTFRATQNEHLRRVRRIGGIGIEYIHTPGQRDQFRDLANQIRCECETRREKIRRG